MSQKLKSGIAESHEDMQLPDQPRTVGEIYDEIRQVYKSDDRPWVIGYSGGKDSTTALQLIWYALAGLPKEDLSKPVYVISSDTLVETPVVIDVIDSTLASVERNAKGYGLPFTTAKVKPKIQDTFWVNLIGRGYPAPSTTFRWCTDRLKITPADTFILEKVSEYGEVVLVLGVRKGESNTRDQVISLHKIKNTLLSRHSKFAQTYVYTPVVDFTVDDIWMYLLSVDSPWGGDNQELAELYRASNAGECPLVIDDTTPSCGSSRFGCWTCTVIGKDKTMESLVGTGEIWLKPLLTYRNLLAETQVIENKHIYRDFKRRTGQVTLKTDKTNISRGPYRLEFREELLERLLRTQCEVRELSGDNSITLIYPEELHEIRRLWRLEMGDWIDRVPRIYRKVMGHDLPWVKDDGAVFDYQDYEVLERICLKHDLPTQLVVRLIDAERRTQGMARRASIFNNLSRVLHEEWRSEEEVMDILKDTFEV